MSLASSELLDSGRIAVVTLSRHKGNNALSSELCAAVSAELDRVLESSARVVVLRSSADHFCVGADLRERATLDAVGMLRAREVSTELTQRILTSPIPVITAVHGFTLGGGLELALVGDLIVADDTATLAFPEAGIGIIPGGGGTQLLARRVGFGQANLLLYTGRRVSAHDALQLGLVDQVAAAGESTSTALQIAREIAAKNPQSIRLIKDAVAQGAGRDVASALAVEDEAWRTAARSADYREGLAAFAAKSTPSWASHVPAQQ
jgi:enoyl-CoA hydratase/carnithine racemase